MPNPIIPSISGQLTNRIKLPHRCPPMNKTAIRVGVVLNDTKSVSIIRPNIHDVMAIASNANCCEISGHFCTKYLQLILNQFTSKCSTYTYKRETCQI